MKSRECVLVTTFLGTMGVTFAIFCSTAIAGSDSSVYLPALSDPIAPTKPISPSVLHKAARDPELTRAYHLLVGPRSSQGVDLTTQLAEAGNPLAQTALCVIYRFGYHFPANAVAALPWCRQAAEQGYGFGALELAQTLRALPSSDPSHNAEILHWTRQAARQEIPIAYILLVRFYSLGEYVSADREIAKQLSTEGIRLQQIFSESDTPGAGIQANDGGTMDCSELLDSQRYRYELNVPRDDKRASALLKQSSAKGCWAAQLDLYARSADHDPNLPNLGIYVSIARQSARDREIAAAYGQPVASVINH